MAGEWPPSGGRRLVARLRCRPGHSDHGRGDDGRNELHSRLHLYAHRSADAEHGAERSLIMAFSVTGALRKFKSARSIKRPSRYPAVVLAAIGIMGLLFAIFCLADVLAPYDYRTQALRQRLMPPVFLGGTTAHLLGTDELGRDILSRLIYAIRFSILVALGGTAIGAFVGTILGF